MIQKFVLALLLGASTLAAGCNTVEGAGRDIERGGEKMQGAAERAR
ncbi:entericidin A/B family lipoprotein [Achromobacter sp. GG226]|nr:entericidin A/B family lipoprotein [Verticiella sp. GG226]MBU4609881.1 entericidin A/B family lipoprotein [Verticiella sp. GG226]